MRRTKSRILAWVLTVALVLTTFASDFASIVTYADGTDEQQAVEEPAQPAEEPAAEPAQEEPAQDPEPEAEPEEPQAEPEEPQAEPEEVIEEEPAEEVSEEPAEEVTEEVEEVTEEVTDAPEENTNVITISYNTTEGGKVYKGEDEYVDYYEEKVDLSAETVVYIGTVAVADEGYTFKYWKDADDNTVSEEATFIPEGLTESKTFTAVFEEIVEEVVEEEVEEVEEEKEEKEEVKEEKIVTVTYKAAEGGSVSKETESVNINDEEAAFEGAKATADEGYKFIGWKDADGNIVSEDPTYVPSNIEEDATFTASFEKEEEPEVAGAKVVTITYKATEGGSVSKTSEKIDLEDKEAKIEGSTATADEGYEFIGWKDANGTVVWEEAKFTPSNIEKDTTFTAAFELKEVEMPAITYHRNANGIYVRIDAPEGAFPQGTKAIVEAVNDDSIINAATSAAQDASEDDLSVEKVLAVDITFEYDGKEIEPEVPISVSLTTGEIANADEAKVVHVDDSGNASVVGANIHDNKAEFSSDAFSVYAIVTGIHDENSRLTVEFVKFEDGETKTIASIYVKQSDDMETVLYDPGVGKLPDGVNFEGWAEKPDYTADTTGLTIAGVRKAIKDDYDWDSVIDGDTVTYYAILIKQYKITYLDNNDVVLGQASIDIRADEYGSEVDYFINQAYTPSDDVHDFQGWFVDTSTIDNVKDYVAGTAYKNEVTVTITGDVIFTVNSPQGHWLIFKENGKGATYVAPQFILDGEVTVEPSVTMTRNGYTFAKDEATGISGWYTDAACTEGNEFVFGNEI